VPRQRHLAKKSFLKKFFTECHSLVLGKEIFLFF
jgi:hypothetical protein